MRERSCVPSGGAAFLRLPSGGAAYNDTDIYRLRGAKLCLQQRVKYSKMEGQEECICTKHP